MPDSMSSGSKPWTTGWQSMTTSQRAFGSLSHSMLRWRLNTPQGSSSIPLTWWASQPGLAADRLPLNFSQNTWALSLPLGRYLVDAGTAKFPYPSHTEPRQGFCCFWRHRNLLPHFASNKGNCAGHPYITPGVAHYLSTPIPQSIGPSLVCSVCSSVGLQTTVSEGFKLNWHSSRSPESPVNAHRKNPSSCSTSVAA